MKRAVVRRWLAWVALAVFTLQTGLPTLRLATASAGALRAEAILATSLCSKPTLGLADKIDALLSPWQQHRAKGKYQHCDSCPQNVDAPVAVLSATNHFSDLTSANLIFARSPVVSFAPPVTVIPPSRAPPNFS